MKIYTISITINLVDYHSQNIVRYALEDPVEVEDRLVYLWMCSSFIGMVQNLDEDHYLCPLLRHHYWNGHRLNYQHICALIFYEKMNYIL